jgi:hypothetical protein
LLVVSLKRQFKIIVVVAGVVSRETNTQLHWWSKRSSLWSSL